MAQVNNQIAIKLDGIGHVLKDNKLRVPAYQRSYSWLEDNVNDLLFDIRAAFTNADKEYFLGSCVLTGTEGDCLDVVDGQQRLTTVVILIAAIRDHFKEQGDTNSAQAIERDFIATLARRGGDLESRLRLNEIDNQLFQESIVEGKELLSFVPNKSSHERLLQAKRVVQRFVAELANQSRNTEAYLHDWIDYLELNVKLIVVQAPDDSNAFVIFEALNDRGLDLAISDLIKNYIFQKSGDKIEETKQRWLLTNGILEGVSDDPLLAGYLRHFCSARYGIVREKELFGIIKKKVGTKKLAIEFANDLYASAKRYAALINTDHDFWTVYQPDVKEAAQTLNTLGMTQIRPLFLVALEKLSKSEIEKLAPKLVSIAVRFQVVGGSGAGTLERLYSEAARKISDGKLTAANDIVNSMTNVPTDIQFRQAFLQFSISRTNLARFYLRALETHANTELDGQQQATTNPGRVNLEHVLPQNPADLWGSTFSSDQAKTYYKRLGNLALLSARLNVEIGNDKFSEKKHAYLSSPFVLTKEIAIADKWDVAQIEKRQERLADLAVSLWSL